MAKQLNVNLAFTADTSQAKAQLQSLQTQLSGLLNSTNGQSFGNQITGDINKASKAIAELKLHLKNATNVNTGNLDFTKLNESLNKSGTTLQQYGDKLRSLGPAGQQAFNTLASSIAQSEIPIRRSNAALTELWITLKNTVRWQISSSILHGFMSTISGAVGYAKDLNKSLNDIRIVTGASVDEMARFAEQANRSAKALSASTTAYTKASLIYYQQGLDDQAVKERTDVTIKMANVSSQSAETVSDQMTAVWNNFAKGGENLERFADVMVRLGADTASSSDEIAQGLEKFAAIGDMVGLSFDNAAAALATVTATTRQSADVVGTAFKTIFARIQGLKLGDTLEDGTDLNKYSEALAAVGISVKEQNGELKDMDNILAEMGAKWKTLSKDQQVALAQTVAGLRQYNQLVALMENFDFYEQNLQSAKNAEGSLQEQADIYAESWQAASDRVKAATQGIYEDLLNDEAFIDVLNTIEKILTYVDNLIDGLGGLGGVLTTIGALLTRAFSSQIAQSMTGIVNGIKMMTAAGREQAQQQKAQFMKDSADAMRGMSDGSNEGNMRATMMEDQLRLQTSMIENSERMSAEEQQINQMLLDRQRILSDNAIAAAKELDAATEARSDATFNARVELAQEARGWAGGDLEVQKKNLSEFTKQFNQVQQKLKQGITARVNLEELRKLPVEGEKGKQVIDKIKQAVDKIDDTEIKEIVNSLDTMELNAENVEDAIAALTIRLREMQSASEANMMDENNEWMLSEDAVHGLSTAYEDEAMAALRTRDAEEQANEARDNVANSINNATGAQKTWADQMVAGANAVMSIMSALQALNGIIDVATNPDMSGWEKFLSIGSSLAMVFVILAPLFQKNNLELLNSSAASLAAAMGMKAETVAALEAAAATGTFTTALFTLLWPILAVVGAIALLVGGLKLANSIYNADAKAAEKAGEAAEKATKQFEEVQNKYNEFKDTISNHDEAIEGLAKLTKGTIEYKEQIIKANEEALKLINSQDLLYGTDYKYNDEGLIEFTPGRLEQARKQEFNNLERLEANKSFTAQRAKTAEEKANLTEFARNNLNDDGGIQSEDWSSLIKGASWAASGAAIGATLGTVVPGIGNAVGAIGGAIIGGITGLGAGLIDVFTDDIRGDASKNEVESMRKLAEAYDKQGDKALTPDNIKKVLGENNTILDDVFAKPTAEMAKALIEKQDSDAKFNMKELNDLFAEKGEDITPEDLKAYFDQNGIKMDQASIDQMFQSIIDPEVKSQIASLAANTAAIRGHIERTAGAANQDNEDYQRLSKEDQSIADKIIANRVDDALADKDSKAYAQLEKDAIKAWQEESGSKQGFFKGDESLTYDKYMEIIYGKDWKDNYKVENMGGTNATIYQKNEEGKWENIDPDDKKNTLSNAEVKEALVEYYAKQYGDADAAKLAEVNTAAAEVRANVGGIGTIADQDIKSAFASGETADLSFMTKEQVNELKAELENGTIKVTDEYKKLLLDGANAWSEAAHEVRKEAEANSIISEGASKYDLDEKVLQAQSKMLQQTHKDLKDNVVAAAEMAVANQRLNKGVNKLTDNWEDWNKTLRSSDKTTQDYAEAVVGVQDAMRDMFGLTEDAVIPEDFLQDTENLDLLNQIANGSEEAAQKLHFNLTKAQIEAETFSSDIAQNMVNAFDFGDDVDLEATFNEMKNQALNALTEIQSMANGIDIGAGLKDPAKQAEMAAKLNEYAMAAGWTAEQMQSALASVGVRAKITMIEGNPVTKKIPITRITRSFPKFTSMEGPDGKTHYGFSQDETSEVVGYKEVTEPTLVPQIDMEDPNNPSGQIAPIFEKVDMGNITPSVTSGGKNSGGGKGGGGGGGSNKPSKPKTIEPTEQKKKNDEVERYHEINQELEDLQNTLDEISELKDEAWGADKLAQMDKEKKKLQEITSAHKRYQDEIEKNLNDDRWEAESKYGAIIDPSSGRITNYEELQEKWMNEWNAESQRLDALEQDYENKIAASSDEEKETLEEEKEKNVTAVRKDLDKEYEEKRKAIEQYEETLNLSEEAQRQLDDYLRQMRQLNYEQLEYKIEFRVEINENDIADIEHQLERLGDNNIYASAERIALIEQNAANYRNIADIQMAAIKEAEQLYAAGQITQIDYMTKLQESKDALQEAEISIREGIEQIGDELENIFDLADEKLDRQFTKFDQMIELMDHYKNVVSLAKGEASYKEFNKILKASQEILRDRIEADKSEIAMWTARREQLDADMKNMDKNSPEYLAAEEALNNIMEKEADAKSQLMADIEQLGEYAREIFENSIEQAMKDFEDEMFGRPLNSIIESIEMMNSRQEELLTTTNKIYETNKLIRNVEKDIEATTNNRAKQAFAEFQNKVKQKQEQNELTKFELDLLTAEYEMTKAQIALEEAQNAKDTVRLTRDAEGNYGYVYTANEDKVADAEQALDDATNNYYNTALEGAQKYQDQIYQHIQEWEEKTAEVIRDTELNEEEKNRKIKEINDTYNTLIKQDKELYYMAVGAMQESAYNTQVDYDLKGIKSAENWFVKNDSFLSDLEDAQDEYDRNTEEISEHTEENFGKMSTAIRNTKQESEYLKNQIVNELVPELDTTLKDSIDNATEAWWKYIEALQEVIRLTDEAMKKNHDTQLKEGYKDNYAAEIQERLANGANYSDYDIQRLLEYRWEKMSGIDNTDYAALIAAGGTPEQIALWEVLRRFKIEQTDWSASNKTYANEMRENKLDQDYSQLIIDYLSSKPYGRWDDAQVQKYLNERQIKINEQGLADQVMSNAELKQYIDKQLKKDAAQLNTGGYTGDWGPEGKLAVLHEKELVLNRQDTENFLSAAAMLREISQMLDNNALVASLGMINLRAMTINSPADQILQQEVHISADFPNVTDHNEIEMAIDNLINAASQYAYRK